MVLLADIRSIIQASRQASKACSQPGISPLHPPPLQCCQGKGNRAHRQVPVGSSPADSPSSASFAASWSTSRSCLLDLVSVFKTLQSSLCSLCNLSSLTVSLGLVPRITCKCFISLNVCFNEPQLLELLARRLLLQRCDCCSKQLSSQSASTCLTLTH